MGLTIRRELEQREREILSPYACLSTESRGRLRDEDDSCDMRTVFQRDRDRIIHSKEFRRLKHKTQVFLAPAGDHYRTRLTHVLEVAQIARTIAVCLHLNENLTEAIALGHDLGHTPFGHAGEYMLNELHPGGFRHYVQSLRVVNFLAGDGHGLNLTWEVRNGIVTHSKGYRDILPEKGSELPATMEGQAVRVADIIAYLNHDFDDALRASMIRETDLPEQIRKVVGDTSSQRIDTMVRDLIGETMGADDGRLYVSDRMQAVIVDLRTFLYDHVYTNEWVHNEFVKARKIIKELYEFFLEYEFPKDIFTYTDWARSKKRSQTDKPPHREVCDFIAGMTDRYALDLYKQIFIPQPWGTL